MATIRYSALACVVAMAATGAWAQSESTAPPPTVNASPQGRPWDLSIRAFFGYDSNFAYVADDSYFIGDDDAYFVGTQVNGEYRFLQRKELTAGVVGRLEAKFYPDKQRIAAPFTATGDPDDYNLINLGTGLYGQYRFMVRSMPATATLRYDYRQENGKDLPALGLDSHRITTDLSIMPRPDVTVALLYAHEWTDFDVTFDNPPTSLPDPVGDRDADVDRVKLSGKWRFHPVRTIEVYYQYINNDAVGSNWAYDAHGIGLRLESHLIGPLFGAFQFDYLDRDYGPPFVAGFPFASGAPAAAGRTEQDDYHYTGQLLLVVNEHVSLDFFTTFSEYDGGISDFQVERFTVGFGITYKF